MFGKDKKEVARLNGVLDLLENKLKGIIQLQEMLQFQMGDDYDLKRYSKGSEDLAKRLLDAVRYDRKYYDRVS